MEKRIWDNIKQGDKKAFQELYQSHYQHLFASGYRLLANREAVKDCIHEMFCEIWNSRHQAPQVTNPRAYLCTYLKRKLLKELQQAGNLDGHLPESPAHEPSYEELLVQHQSNDEMRLKLHVVLGQLTKTQREIINLKYYQELSYEEIATVMGVQPRTAYNQVYEALKQLRKHLKTCLPLGIAAKIMLLQNFF